MRQYGAAGAALPQSLDTTDSPTFAGLQVNGDIDGTGRSTLNLTLKVDNETGGTLSKGSPVYVSSTHASGRPSVTSADANGASTYPSIGLVYADISTGTTGYVVETGIIEDVAAAQFVGTDPSVGDTLYLSETAGKLTVDRPLAPATAVQNVGRVTKTNVSVSGGTGTAHVLVQNPGRENDQANSCDSVYFTERAAAQADTAGYGQLWVKNAAPTELYFTTDAGDDIQLTSGTSAAGGGGVAADDENLILHMQTFA